MNDITISDSAFLVNESRSKRTDISKDIYSHLWTSESTSQLWNDFSSQVYPYDDIEISLRNRFFLEHLKEFIKLSNNPVFINVGSGFTSYPFLINDECKWVEIDLKNVIDFKKEKIDLWIKQGILPKRDITFLSDDINNKAGIEKFKETLKYNFRENPSFVLLEGITYFLTREAIKTLFNSISEIQIPGSILAFDFWKSSNSNHPVFKLLCQFFEKRFGFNDKNYNYFDFKSIEKIKGYKILELLSIQDLEKKFTVDNYLDEFNKILPEYYTILKLEK